MTQPVVGLGHDPGDGGRGSVSPPPAAEDLGVSPGDIGQQPAGCGATLKVQQGRASPVDQRGHLKDSALDVGGHAGEVQLFVRQRFVGQPCQRLLATDRPAGGITCGLLRGQAQQGQERIRATLDASREIPQERRFEPVHRG